MRLAFIRRLILFIIFALSFGCVTVSVSEKKGRPAENLEVVPPSAPFEELKTPDADRAWQNARNGTSISYASECGGADPSLKSIQQTILQGLTDINIEAEEKTNFNSREALDTTASGNVDGVAVRIRFLTFKKNNCNFTLNYFAVAKHFDSGLPAFQQFVTKFRAP